jgi:hypothetical protein
MMMVLIKHVLHLNARHFFLAEARLDGFLLGLAVEILLKNFLVFSLLLGLIDPVGDVGAGHSRAHFLLLFGWLIEDVLPQDLF